MKKWIETSTSICEIIKSDDLSAKKRLLLEIFGLNLKMQNKKVVLTDKQFQLSPQKKPWVLLRKTIEKAALAGDNFRIGSDLVGREGLSTYKYFS